MSLLDWIIFVSPILVVIVSVCYTQKYMRSVTDFLAASRTAGRYLLTSANGLAGFGLITLVVGAQIFYHSGWAVGWWNSIVVLVTTILALSGFVFYRFRETRALTLAEFFEMRYSRKFRIFMGAICWLSGVINYGIFPAVGASFFICFLGLPEQLCGIPTYPLLMALFLGMSCLIVTLGGQIQNMVTDSIQAIFVYAMSITIGITILVMFDRAAFQEVLCRQPAGMSFINPFDTAKISDFNIFWILINLFMVITHYGSWQGNQGYAAAALTPHEAKMGNILGTWRQLSITFFSTLVILGGLVVINGSAYQDISISVKTFLNNNFSPAVADQMSIPMAISVVLPLGIKGLLASVLFFLMLSTDTTYIHSWGSILVQDVVLPIYGKRISPKIHLLLLRLSLFGVAVFAFLFSLLYQQSEYLQMFQMLTGAIFGAGAGCAILGGLYWKRATNTAAWCAALTGVILALGNIFLLDARCWGVIREWLLEYFPDSMVLLAAENRCPINGAYLSLITTLAAQTVFIIVSFATCREPFNLERMLHRGEYAVQSDAVQYSSCRIPWYKRLFLGFDEEFTLSDKIISLSVSIWSYGWGAAFLVISMWNVLGYLFPDCIGMWPDDWWFGYFWINLWATVILTPVTVVWMTWGSIRDLYRMFKLLKNNREQVLDDGYVEKR